MGILSGSSGSSTPAVCSAVPLPATDVDINSEHTLHTTLMIVGGAFAAGAILVSTFAHLMHATHYSNPREQVKIMRIIFFIPALALVSWGCIALQLNAWYLQPWSYIFEAFALASFFMLVCDFISPNAEDHADFFDQLKLKDGKVAGSAWFFRARRAVYQYTPVAVILGIAQDATFAAGVFCVTQTNIHFAKLWLTIIKAISTTVAVLSILALVRRMRSVMPNKRLFFKLFAFKIIVFLEFIQNIVFNFISSRVKPTETVSYADLTTGIPGLLLCIEAFLASILMFFAYSWKPYVSPNRDYGNPFMAIIHSLNLLDAVKEFLIAFGLTSQSHGHQAIPLQEYGQDAFEGRQSPDRTRLMGQDWRARQDDVGHPAAYEGHDNGRGAYFAPQQSA